MLTAQPPATKSKSNVRVIDVRSRVYTPQPVRIVRPVAPRRFYWPPDRATALVEKIAKKHKLHYRQLIGYSHARCYLKARYEAFYCLREELGMKLDAIGALMCRDHKTVHAGIEKFRAMLAAGEATL